MAAGALGAAGSAGAEGAAGAGAAGGAASAEGSGKRGRAARLRWAVYLLAGGAASATIGPWLVLVLLGCGGFELALRHGPHHTLAPALVPPFLAGVGPAISGSGRRRGAGVGRLGGVQGRGAVVRRRLRDHSADAGRCGGTALDDRRPVPQRRRPRPDHPRPGRADGLRGRLRRRGLPGGLLAAFVAFTPSLFVLGGGRYSTGCGATPAQSSLDGAGPAAIGAIFGSAIPLGRELSVGWQFGVLGGAAVLLLVLRRGVVLTLLTAAAAGLIIALAGGPLPG